MPTLATPTKSPASAPPTSSHKAPPTESARQPINTFTTQPPTGTTTSTSPSKPVTVSNTTKTTPSVLTEVTGSGHTVSVSGTLTRPPSLPVVGLGPAGQEAPHLVPYHDTVEQHPVQPPTLPVLSDHRYQ